MSCLSGPAQIRNILVFTFPLVMWVIGPLKIILQECWKLQYSSKINSLLFHFGATDGVTFTKSKELYSFMMTGFGGFAICSGACCWCIGCGGGDWGGGLPWLWPLVAWFINNSALMHLLSTSNSQSVVLISLRIAALMSGSWVGDWGGVNNWLNWSILWTKYSWKSRCTKISLAQCKQNPVWWPRHWPIKVHLRKSLHAKTIMDEMTRKFSYIQLRVYTSACEIWTQSTKSFCHNNSWKMNLSDFKLHCLYGDLRLSLWLWCHENFKVSSFNGSGFLFH